MSNRPRTLLAVLCLFGLLSSCDSTTTTTPPTTTTAFSQTNLVSDTAVFTAAHTDPVLINAWGLAFGGTGKPWLSAADGSVTTIYDTTGATQLAAIPIPAPGASTGGNPTGIVFSASTTDFGGNHFIFATEQGTIVGWKTGATSSIVADQPAGGAHYTGLAIVASASQIYAADFVNGKVDVFDKNFSLVSSFKDATLPAGYAPFGVQNIHDTLYVTFALQTSEKDEDSTGRGLGFVDRYTSSGTLIGRFASNGNLNAPWGVALAPASFGQFANAILIGNFGDGTITAYNNTGGVIGKLKNSAGSEIGIEGLWALSFNPTAGSDPNKLFFTAGPYDESHGLFGYLTMVP